MYKTKFIKANWRKYNGEKIIGTVNGELLASIIEKESNAMKKLVSIQPVISGDWGNKVMWEGGAGWGYSYTEGVIIIYEKV